MAEPTTTSPNNNQLKSTQNSLIISEIKDGIVILKDGSLRSVVLASAINFDLMSRQEQDAVEFAYQGFLNSLHFPIQIVVRSQKIDLDGYIESLDRLRQSQDNELLGLLMEDYIANIKGLIEEVNIMNKQFYVVVPFFPPVITKTGFVNNLTSILKPASVTTVGEADFNTYKTELSQRVALVASGLNQMGIRAIPLNTQELIDLYYSTYNPDVATNQKLIDASQLQEPSVRRGSPAPVVAPPAPTPAPEPAPVAAAPATQPQLITPAPAAPAPASAGGVRANPVFTPSAEPAPLRPVPQDIQVAPTPVVSQKPAVNPTGFDPYAVSADSPAAPVAPVAATPAKPAPATPVNPLLGANDAANIHPDQLPPNLPGAQ